MWFSSALSLLPASLHLSSSAALRRTACLYLSRRLLHASSRHSMAANPSKKLTVCTSPWSACSVKFHKIICSCTSKIVYSIIYWCTHTFLQPARRIDGLDKNVWYVLKHTCSMFTYSLHCNCTLSRYFVWFCTHSSIVIVYHACSYVKFCDFTSTG